MRLLSSTVCALATALVCAVSSARADNVDTGGFAQDGSTTYCQGRGDKDSKNPVEFPNMLASNAGRCPILVSLTTSATTVHQGESIDVTWKANAQFKDIPGNIFPQIVNVGAKTSKPVQGSFIKACKAGTNCATVFDGAAGAGAAAGAFDGSGLKDLQAYKFTFPDMGDFILVARVTIEGDTSLGVSTSEFVAFKKITVVDKNTAIAPTPTPTATPTPTPSSSTAPSATTVAPTPSVANDTNTKNLNFTNTASGGNGAGDEAATVSPTDSLKSPSTASSGDASTEGATTKSNSDDDKGFFASHGALLGAVAGICVVVLVVGYAVAMRRKKSNVNASKLQRGQTQTFRMSRSDHMDDPEPVEYISKKTARNSNPHSVPIMSRPSIDSTDGMPIDLSKRGSEMEPSFDEMDSSFVEGTITSSNHAVSTIPRNVSQPRPSSEASKDSVAMLSSMYSEARSTAVYQGKTQQQSVGRSEEERAFYKSEAWYPDATARPQDREQSTISFTEHDDTDSNSRRGFEAPSFDSNSRRGFEAPSFSSEFDVTERVSRMNSEASVDSYAFRPSNVSVAESYKSRVSRYSGFSDDMDRESSRISGMSLYSDRDTNV